MIKDDVYKKAKEIKIDSIMELFCCCEDKAESIFEGATYLNENYLDEEIAEVRQLMRQMKGGDNE